MDMDQINFPPEGAKARRRFSRESGSGFLWFLETSYGYINPRGLREHVSFSVGFFPAWFGFRRAMKSTPHNQEPDHGN